MAYRRRRTTYKRKRAASRRRAPVKRRRTTRKGLTGRGNTQSYIHSASAVPRHLPQHIHVNVNTAKPKEPPKKVQWTPKKLVEWAKYAKVPLTWALTYIGADQTFAEAALAYGIRGIEAGSWAWENKDQLLLTMEKAQGAYDVLKRYAEKHRSPRGPLTPSNWEQNKYPNPINGNLHMPMTLDRFYDTDKGLFYRKHTKNYKEIRPEIQPGYVSTWLQAVEPELHTNTHNEDQPYNSTLHRMQDAALNSAAIETQIDREIMAEVAELHDHNQGGDYGMWNAKRLKQSDLINTILKSHGAAHGNTGKKFTAMARNSNVPMPDPNALTPVNPYAGGPIPGFDDGGGSAWDSSHPYGGVDPYGRDGLGKPKPPVPNPPPPKAPERPGVTDVTQHDIDNTPHDWWWYFTHQAGDDETWRDPLG